jgi:HlyD family secretion protein
MDRPIEKKLWTSRRALAVAGGAVVGVALIVMLAMSRTSSLSVASGGRLTVSEVRTGEFREYVPITGTVQPATTVYLDLEEGGIVEKVYAESGAPVKQGDLLLAFSNNSVQKQNIETETRLLENLDRVRNSKISVTQSSLALKEQLLDIEYRITELQRTFARYEQLSKLPTSQISKEQFEATRDQLTYFRNKRDLLHERIRQETILQELQSDQIDSSIVRLTRNLDVLSKIMDSLEVRAPIDGYLSSLDAEVGQNFQRGQRIGQIDQLERFKVRADIDQFYIAKVQPDQRGTFEFDGQRYELSVKKVYPEVTNDTFKVDMEFAGTVPVGIKRGQSLSIDLSLSESKSVAMVAKGGFYRHTNGRWLYLLAEDGRSARRTRVVLGRQNPQFVEVIEGLKPGDWIINSNYDSFDDVDELTFPEPIKR